VSAVRGALIEAVYDAAKKADAVEVYWNTQEFNSVARVLYDRVGERTPLIKYRKVL
jgi:metal-dependent HD superfamily phosphatase/phosphodiesterase